MTYISQSMIDFALYFKDYLMDEHDTENNSV